MDRDFLPGQHPDHGVFQSIHIHPDIGLERFVSLRLVPVCPELMPKHRLYHGLRAVHVMADVPLFPMGDKTITVVPCLCLLETHPMLLTERLHFMFRETEVFCKPAWVCHGILSKHIQRRV